MRARTYGGRRALAQIAWAVGCSLAWFACTGAARAQAPVTQAPVKIVALGDSLTAGFGLAQQDGFVARLQKALTANGIAAEIEDAGVSGDTASGGLARLDWSVPDGTDAVILELGANDMLRGINPDVTRAALDGILSRLKERHVAVLLCGMLAAPNLGADYGRAFEAIFPELSIKYKVPLYPFFLDGVAGNPRLQQADGLHPNAAGVDVIVTNILLKVEALIARLREQKRS
jgi:acyl-CoA thioesterase I